MWSSLFYKIKNYWNLSLLSAPRWISSNSVSTDLLDSVEFTNTNPENFDIVLTQNTDSKIHVDNILPQYTSSNTSSPNLSRITYHSVSESHRLITRSNRLLSKNLLGVDLSDFNIVWVLPYDKPINKVEVRLSDNSYLELPQSKNIDELLSIPMWSWYTEDNNIVLHGFDYIEFTGDRDSAGWNYVPRIHLSVTVINRNLPIFYKIPNCDTWHLLDNYKLSSDNNLGINSEEDIKFRLKLFYLIENLTSLDVRINGERLVARRMPLRSDADDKLLLTGYKKKDIYDFGNNVFRHIELVNFSGQTIDRYRATLASHFSRSSYSLIDYNSESANGDGFSFFKDYPKINFESIRLSPTKDKYICPFVPAKGSEYIINGLHLNLYNGTSVLDRPQFTKPDDYLYIKYRRDNYTEEDSLISFFETIRDQNLPIHSSFSVDIETKKKDKIKPTLVWQDSEMYSGDSSFI